MRDVEAFLPCVEFLVHGRQINKVKRAEPAAETQQLLVPGEVGERRRVELTDAASNSLSMAWCRWRGQAPHRT